MLAIDVGSSSLRCGVYRADGTVVAGSGHRIGHELRHAGTGAAELDPEELLDRTARVVDRSLEAGRAAGVTLDAVAMTTMWHSVCGLDAAERVSVPVLSWADQRSAGAAAELRERLDDVAQHARTGCRLHSSYLPAKLAWLAAEHPDQAGRTAWWLSPGEFLHRRLFGSSTASVSMASGTGLMDQHGCGYDPQVLAALPVEPGQLSPISDEPVSGLLPVWRRRWPELADLPWFPALGDGATSNVGVGCVDSEHLAVMVGTSGAVRVLREACDFQIPPSLWCYRLDQRRPVMGGALNDGGALVDWLRETVRLPDLTQAEPDLATMRPGEHGLTVLPLLAGERSPGWPDTARGAVAGLSMATRPIDLLRAALEAVALYLAAMVAEVDQALPGPRTVIATGGALLASPAWRQILADALGRPVTVSQVPEASSRGAALWVLERLGAIDGLTDPPAPLGAVSTPRAAHHETYQRLLDEQRRLHDLLR